MKLITIFAIEKINNGRSSIQNTDITLAAKESTKKSASLTNNVVSL